MTKQSYNSGERKDEIQLWLLILVFCMLLGIILSACHREVALRSSGAEGGVIRTVWCSAASLPVGRELFSL